MANDDSDRTVFRQSSGSAGGRGDSTVIRPSPGRRSGHTQLPRQSEPARQGNTADNPPPTRSAAPAYVDNQAGQFSTRYGLNPLVNAASMLIAVFHKTRQSVSHTNVAGLHQQLVAAIRSFENVAKEKHIRPEIVLAARYILCAALDEAVLNTPWGAESAWTQRSLLSIFHNETHGGEKFYLILDRMRERPAENLEILELMYILLSLGFEGKYRVISRGREMIENIRDDLHRMIRMQRGEYERQLSARWQGLGRIRNSLASYVPMWVVASVVAGVLVLTYSGFRYWLYESSAHVASQLEEISRLGATDKHTARTNLDR